MKTLNTIYLWLMLAACVLALAGCVEEKCPVREKAGISV